MGLLIAAAATKPAYVVNTFADRAAATFPDHLWLTALLIAVAVIWTLGLMTFLGLSLVYAERKIAAHFQCRLGPMRVGFHGIFQTVADALKLFVKEDFVPDRADKVLHTAAPAFSMIATILCLVILPVSPWLQVADLNVGAVYVTAISGFGVLGILLGGWSSHNKWSLIGAIRAGAQIISYEVTATLALLVCVLFAGTLQLSGIVQSQAQGWWIWRAHGVAWLRFSCT
jgi:NADH-quinone oxidoreductase subunit H